MMNAGLRDRFVFCCVVLAGLMAMPAVACGANQSGGRSRRGRSPDV